MGEEEKTDTSSLKSSANSLISQQGLTSYFYSTCYLHAEVKKRRWSSPLRAKPAKSNTRIFIFISSTLHLHFLFNSPDFSFSISLHISFQQQYEYESVSLISTAIWIWMFPFSFESSSFFFFFLIEVSPFIYLASQFHSLLSLKSLFLLAYSFFPGVPLQVINTCFYSLRKIFVSFVPVLLLKPD